jgi:hypothetical protein
MSPFCPSNLRECEANSEFIAAAHNYFGVLLQAADEIEQLRHLLSAARDFICEGGSIRMVGAVEFVTELDQAADRLWDLVQTQIDT